MWCHLLLLTFVIGLCTSNDYWNEGREGGNIDVGRLKGDDRRCDIDGKCDDNDTNDFDDEKNLYEPCDYSDDVDCVREFFGKYGQCKVVYHDNDKPVYRDRYISYIPKINLTLITTKTRLRNFNPRIERFYINKKTGNLVMSVDLRNMEFNSKLGIFIVSRRGREPAVAKDQANGTYSVVLTAVIPIKEGLTLKALKESRVTAFNPSPLVQFSIGPKVALSKDPAISAAVVALLADIPTALQEFFLSDAPNFFLAYLQKYICDFGIPLSNSQSVRAIYNH